MWYTEHTIRVYAFHFFRGGRAVFIIGIAGGSGSGKTTFAKKILDKLNRPDIFMLHMDSYYLPSPPVDIQTPKGRFNFDHPEAFDWALLRQHLTLLKEGHGIHAPIYDFKTNSRTDRTVHIGPCKILIFEGIFTLFDFDIRELLDIKCFLYVDADIRFTRRLHRDVKDRGRSLESVIEQYYETVRPMYQRFLEPQKQFADITVGEETDVAADIISGKLAQIIGQQSNV